MTEMEQGSEEWFAARVGKLTASRLGDVLAKVKSGPAATRKNYATQLILERVTGKKADLGFTTADMQWGIDTEEEARNAYAFIHDAEVLEVGFIDHPKVDMVGASPDGLVDDKGMVEIKCPKSATHLANLQGAPISKQYFAQMQLQMECCDRSWTDFVSFDPRFPARMQLKVTRVPRDTKWMNEAWPDIKSFLKEVEKGHEFLMKEFGE